MHRLLDSALKGRVGHAPGHAPGLWLANLGACLTFLWPITTGAVSQRDWQFQVFLDDQAIGHHRFFLTRNGPHERLRSEAMFEVTFLKIPLFSYRHENVETWDGQCLQDIRSETDENGKQFRVEGASDGEAFQLSTLSGEATLPGCISTFAYWDKSFLTRDRLLNAQTGEYLDVEVSYLGEQTVPLRNTEYLAHRYLLRTERREIELWYSRDDQWLGLQSTIRGGRVLRYVIE